MKFILGLLAAALLAAAAVDARAGAWPMAPGETQVIVKYEDQRADEGYDLDGTVRPIATRTDRELSVFVEHGLTPRLTLQAKLAVQEGRDAFVDYSGRGPAEIGLRAALWNGERTKISLYGGYVAAGEGRNAGYAAPGAGDGDVDLRLLVGRSGELGPKLGRRPVYAEVQVARVLRDGLPDETRADASVGVRIAPRWTLLNQVYAGRADEGGARWANLETSVVRDLGRWKLQAGWRRAVAGRETPKSGGPVLAVWRTF